MSSPTVGLDRNSTFPKGVTTMTYTFTDSAGGTAICVFTITVTDDDPPIPSCPQFVEARMASGNNANTLSVSLATVSATDNVDGVIKLATLTKFVDGQSVDIPLTSNSAPFDLGTTLVTGHFADASNNNADCEFGVIVRDGTAPTITPCPANRAATITAESSTAVITWTAPTITDNRGATITTTQVSSPQAGLVSGSNFPVGVTTITYTSKDNVDNQAVCSFTVTVTDGRAPRMLSCPEDIAVRIPADEIGAVVQWNAPVAFDNVDGVLASVVAVSSPTADLTSGSFFPLGRTNISYSYTDAAGFAVVCQFGVTITQLIVQNDCNATFLVPEVWSSAGDFVPHGSTRASKETNTDFSTQLVNVETTRTFYIDNIGLGTMSLLPPVVTITSTSAAFFVSQPTVISLPSARSNSRTASFTVTFGSAANGTFTATISVANNAPIRSPYTFVVTGRVVNSVETTEATTTSVTMKVSPSTFDGATAVPARPHLMNIFRGKANVATPVATQTTVASILSNFGTAIARALQIAPERVTVTIRNRAEGLLNVAIAPSLDETEANPAAAATVLIAQLRDPTSALATSELGTLIDLTHVPETETTDVTLCYDGIWRAECPDLKSGQLQREIWFGPVIAGLALALVIAIAYVVHVRRTAARQSRDQAGVPNFEVLQSQTLKSLDRMPPMSDRSSLEMVSAAYPPTAREPAGPAGARQLNDTGLTADESSQQITGIGALASQSTNDTTTGFALNSTQDTSSTIALVPYSEVTDTAPTAVSAVKQERELAAPPTSEGFAPREDLQAADQAQVALQVTVDPPVTATSAVEPVQPPMSDAAPLLDSSAVVESPISDSAAGAAPEPEAAVPAEVAVAVDGPVQAEAAQNVHSDQAPADY